MAAVAADRFDSYLGAGRGRHLTMPVELETLDLWALRHKFDLYEQALAYECGVVYAHVTTSARRTPAGAVRAARQLIATMAAAVGNEPVRDLTPEELANGIVAMRAAAAKAAGEFTQLAGFKSLPDSRRRHIDEQAGRLQVMATTALADPEFIVQSIDGSPHALYADQIRFDSSRRSLQAARAKGEDPWAL